MKRKTQRRWTTEEELIISSVDPKKPVTNQLKRIARSLGRSLNSCQGKYYEKLNYKNKPVQTKQANQTKNIITFTNVKNISIQNNKLTIEI